ncbi:MAG: dihydropteroate synthase [bacterium]
MIIIGEKINATRKSIAKAILSKDRDAIVKQITKQDEAGAHFIDLNAGTGAGDQKREINDMLWLIDIALQTTEKPLSIDSADTAIIKKSAEYLEGKREWMLNSLKNDAALLKELIPVAAEYNSPIIALSMSGESIPQTVEERVENCRRIFTAGEKAGVKPENLFFDPLVIPISSNHTYGKLTIDTLHAIKNEFPESRTTMGVSNISFGLPHRAQINNALLLAAISHGLDSAICDPTKKSTRRAILLGQLIDGRDRYCRSYTRATRKGLFKKKKRGKSE